MDDNFDTLLKFPTSILLIIIISITKYNLERLQTVLLFISEIGLHLRYFFSIVPTVFLLNQNCLIGTVPITCSHVRSRTPFIAEVCTYYV